MPILFRGLLNPGSDGVAVSHGQAGSKTHRTIYLSPSIEYAAFPVYAQFFSLSFHSVLKGVTSKHISSVL